MHDAGWLPSTVTGSLTAVVQMVLCQQQCGSYMSVVGLRQRLLMNHSPGFYANAGVSWLLQVHCAVH